MFCNIVTNEQLVAAVFTIVTGVIVFVLGQSILKVVIEPVQELKKSFGNVAQLLLMNQAKITNALPEKEIADILRERSAEIISKSNIVPFYFAVHLIFCLPSKSKIFRAAQQLNSISYGMQPEVRDYEKSKFFDAKPTNFVDKNTNGLLEVGKLLCIKITYDGKS